MSSPSPADDRLARTQRRLRRLITWPEGVRSALEAEPPGEEPLADIVRSDARLAAEDRLDVYANAYFYRIHDVLAEDFQTLARLLGEDAFHDLATSYLAVYPSHHFSLRHVGGRLADFLADHPAADSFRARFLWAADLARYEAASEDVFDAPGSPAATREDLIAVAPEAWADLEIRLRPCVRLLALDWRVHDARRALRADEPLEEPAPERVRLCLWRRQERVVSREVDADEYQALEASLAGVGFGSLCEQIAAQLGEDDAPARAAAWLASWVDAELVRAG